MTLSMQLIGWWLLQSTIGGGIILFIANLMMLRTRQPVLKQRLGEWGLGAALTAAVLSLFPAWLVLPWSVTGVLSPPDAGPASQPAAEMVAVAQIVPLEIQPDPQAFHPAPAPVEWQHVPVQTVDVKVAEKPAAPPPVQKAPDFARIAVAVLVAAYAVGLTVFLLRLALAFAALRRLVRRAVPVPPAIQALAAELLPGRRLRLLTAPRVRIPISFGLFRPTIVLPAALCRNPDVDKLRWVLAHEATHLQRRDSWSSLLCAVAQAVFFFLPWCWSICRHIRLCQEFVADASAVGDDHQADYAAFLLSLTKTPALPLVATGVSGSSSDLYRRVTMLVEKPIHVERTCSRRWLLIAASALLGLAVVVSGVGLADGTGRRTIIIITEKGDDAKKQDGDAKQGVYSFRLIAPGATEDVKKQKKIIIKRGDEKAGGAQHQHKRIIIRRAVGPDGKIVEEGEDVTVKPGRIGFRVKKDGKNEDVKIIKGKDGVTIIKIGDLAIPIPNEKGNVPKFKEDIQKRIRIWKPGTGNPLIVPKDGRKRIAVEIEVDKSSNAKAIEEALKKLDGVLGKKDVEKLREQIREALKKADNRFKADGARLWRFVPEVPKVRPELNLFKDKGGVYSLQYVPQSSKAKLGVELAKPSQTLADQLNLPEGKGVVILRVVVGSAAEKAGIQANDILLEIAGQSVSNEPDELIKQVSGLKGDKAISAVVLRKGKRRSIKGIKIASQKSPLTQYYLQTAPNFAGGRYVFVPSKNTKSESMTLMRHDNGFQAHYQKGPLSISVTGDVVGKKAKIQRILIRAGGQSRTFDSVGDVPEEHRARVATIVDTVTATFSKSKTDNDE